MSLAVELFISALLVVGGCFGLVGSIGLLKLRAPMQRLHAPTKAVTMGVATTLIAAALELYLRTGIIAWQNLMVAPFLFLTAPLSALYLAKAHLHTTVDPADLPAAAGESDWAVRSDSAPTKLDDAI
jgi:multicomponent K+:H+ antiporter subunit G